ncbi:MAG: hypothetical protein MK180_11965 [Rhodobacteraceae bacterium]|nr:hypothetical protein [Paracoccaceae bacterium]
MELAALFLLFGGSLVGLLFSGASASAEADEITVDEDGVVLGTAGDDLITVGDGEVSTEVEAGAGDDTILDLDPSTDLGNYDGGSGDDIIAVAAGSGVISGGEGNDTISVLATGLVAVDAGEGDDFIEAITQGVVFGGEGNDTLSDGVEIDQPSGTLFGPAGAFSGGAGDDLIYVQGLGDASQEVVQSAVGGAGDDVIVIDTRVASDLAGYQNGLAPRVAGGEGIDMFTIQTEDVILEDVDDFIALTGGDDHFTVDVYRDQIAEIADFEPGVDVLTVDADAVTQNGVLSEARIEEVSSGADTMTVLTLVYENADQRTIEAQIVLLGTTGVSWSDVVFLGEQMPELAAA